MDIVEAVEKAITTPNSKYVLGSVLNQVLLHQSIIGLECETAFKILDKYPYTIGFIDKLMEEKKLDGIECFHPSADEDKMRILVEYARNHNLYISGGSDFHGHKKPDVEIGVGKGNLHILKDYIEEWV